MKRSSFVLVSVMLFAVIGMIACTVCVERYKSTTARLLSKDRLTAGLLSLVLEERLRQIVKSMESYANRPLLIQAVISKDRFSMTRDLAILTASTPGIVSVIVTDRNGQILSSYPNRPELAGRSFSYRDWYQGGSRDWTPFISNAVVRLVAEKDLAVQIAVLYPAARGEESS